MVGYLHITLGPMFAGKTKQLITKYYEASREKNVVAINYYLDTRYGDNKIVSHDLIEIPCIMVENIMDIWFDSKNPHYHELNDADYILINEGQFFKNLDIVVRSMVECGKKVFIYALDGDFKREKFGEILDLIPYCDYVEKKTAFCEKCYNKALFTHKNNIAENSEQVDIGVTNYKPLCRKCYDKENPVICEIISPVD
tara:strand:- start:6152 stop:6745 length:594 start_codon:yes stop_codon:yes gene_type:complete